MEPLAAGPREPRRSPSGVRPLPTRLTFALTLNPAVDWAVTLRHPRIVRPHRVDRSWELSVRLGTEAPHEMGLESATPPRWRERGYDFDVRWRGGRLPIRLELGALSRRDPIQLAHLDRIEIRRIGPDGAPGARP